MKKVLVGFLAVSVLAGVSVFYFDGPVVLTPATHAASVLSVVPADLQIAERLGRINRLSFNSLRKLPEPNTGPAATAAYDLSHS